MQYKMVSFFMGVAKQIFGNLVKKNGEMVVASFSKGGWQWTDDNGSQQEWKKDKINIP